MPAPTTPTADPAAPGALPGAASAPPADAHAELATIGSDLDRLQALLADACGALLASFHGAQAHLGAALAPDAEAAAAIGGARDALGNAVLALQFEDIASQLIAHSQRRLRLCAERIACPPPGDGAQGAAPQRPHPVAQRQMDAGAVELF